MNAGRLSVPCSISAEPVLPAAGQLRRRERVVAEQADDLDALLGGVQGAALALDVADLISRSMIAARVAGVPMPESFIASRSSASWMSLPAVSIAASSDASV